MSRSSYITLPTRVSRQTPVFRFSNEIRAVKSRPPPPPAASVPSADHPVVEWLQQQVSSLTGQLAELAEAANATQLLQLRQVRGGGGSRSWAVRGISAGGVR